MSTTYILPILLLLASNVFMTFAWYGHLNYTAKPLWMAVMASWGIAFFEYWLAVPANRWGSEVYSAAQLKTMQEVITLVVFAAFSVAVMVLIVVVHGRTAPGRYLSVTLGFLLGGAVGNFIDRIALGHVTDWVDIGVGTWRFYTFNVADMAVTAAVLLLIGAPNGHALAEAAACFVIGLLALAAGSRSYSRPYHDRLLDAAGRRRPRAGEDLLDDRVERGLVVVARGLHPLPGPFLPAVEEDPLDLGAPDIDADAHLVNYLGFPAEGLQSIHCGP